MLGSAQVDALSRAPLGVAPSYPAGATSSTSGRAGRGHHGGLDDLHAGQAVRGDVAAQRGGGARVGLDGPVADPRRRAAGDREDADVGADVGDRVDPLAQRAPQPHAGAVALLVVEPQPVHVLRAQGRHAREPDVREAGRVEDVDRRRDAPDAGEAERRRYPVGGGVGAQLPVVAVARRDERGGRQMVEGDRERLAAPAPPPTGAGGSDGHR